ncbi:MAG: type II toxin-antitoxin system HicB family antitoxin [Bacteroidota bacterium]|nr:type II toxin-antitoxin system HicB family antitoxin [Bacteroidota bacterium]MDP4232496.1 type II toxin-antitoxin system HicB family antitoxin [Bacteroidota bacterium]MDP4241632.1 type II toxin-antitoxin system HicB family antitoxin [Bacteroidota bacterium]MDP4286376.1 type II toxin-antitoxin system HicB family antitoxin [Bacteroidota bacterium]
MKFTIEYEREADGRWIAEVIELPGALAYGSSPDEAMAHAKAIALHALAERLEHGEAQANLTDVTFLVP